jgi:hypothetical protein
MKYYWILYKEEYNSRTCPDGYLLNDIIKGIHPIKHELNLNSQNKNNNYLVTLLNWKEITEEEYNLFLEDYNNR